MSLESVPADQTGGFSPPVLIANYEMAQNPVPRNLPGREREVLCGRKDHRSSGGEGTWKSGQAVGCVDWGS